MQQKNRDLESDQEKVGSIRAVERALAILSILAEQGSPMGVAELAGRMDLHTSTVHRMLTTLFQQAWVDQEPDTARYFMGPRLLGVGASALAGSTLIHEARATLVRISELSGCNSYLSTLLGRRVTYLARQAGPLGPTLRSDFEPGVVSHPLHTMADGKLLLAHSPPEEQERYLSTEDLRAYTASTITSRESLEAELQMIRKCGHAVDRAERYAFLKGIAVPVHDRSGQVIASLLCWGRIELDDAQEQRISQEMAFLSDELSDAIKSK